MTDPASLSAAAPAAGGREPADARVIRLSVDVFVTLVLIVAFGWLSFSYVAPFVPILMWSAVLAVALHPLYRGLVLRMGGREGRAALVLGLIGVLLILAPAFMIGSALVESFGDLARRLGGDDVSVPPPSEAVKAWPLIGPAVFAQWSEAHADLNETLRRFAPQLRAISTSLLAAGAGVALGVLQFALSVAFAAVFLRFAEPLTEALGRLASRAASERGRLMLSLSAATIRSVSRGVLGVAVVQGVLAGVGVVAMGLPFAGFLAAILLMACIVQAPPLAFLPVIALAWSVDGGVWALFFTIYMIAVMFLDNVLKPMLLGRGLTTPMPVILVGVIGGTLSSGLLGLFVGPVVLALVWELIRAWSAPETAADEVARAADAPPSG
ncbi:MAG: AI-2E family transporter [Pseudomonadota bacterium]